MFRNDKKYSKSRQKGNLGEELACLFLMKQGFKIIDRNYLCPWGEVDIVAQKEGILRFVEVKSVSCEIDIGVSREIASPVAGLRPRVTHETSKVKPEENLTEFKLEKLKRAIKTYMIEHKISRETGFQIDLITVRIDRKNKTALVEKFDTVG